MNDRVRYLPGAVCPNCGFVYEYVDQLDSHDLVCPGPIRLVFLPNGDIVGEAVHE